MTKWTPDFNTKAAEGDLHLAGRVWRWLSRQRLARPDLVLVISNGAASSYRGYVCYRLADPATPPQQRAVGLAAGLDDVTVILNPDTCEVVGVTRRYRRCWLPPYEPSWPQRPLAWTPLYAERVTADGLLLSDHAGQRMQHRALSPQDLVFAIRFGKCLHRRRQVYYTLLDGRRPKVQAGRWTRLAGTTLVVCPYTGEIITVWRDRETAHRRLKRRPKKHLGPPRRRRRGRPRHDPTAGPYPG